MKAARLRGAKTHNLKNLDLDLEPGTFVVLAGPSGSGKSSLAFSTLYAEGQRRYVESFSAYARQFLERLSRPPVDELEPVPAGIAVDRQAPIKTSRSSVATMTEIADYAKECWAQMAELQCPACERSVKRDTAEFAADEVLKKANGARVVVTFPLGVRDAESFLGVREALVQDGYRRIWKEGAALDLDEVRPSDVAPAAVVVPYAKIKTKKTKRKAGEAEYQAHVPLSIVDVVADRLLARQEERSRLVEALEAAMRKAHGRVDVIAVGGARYKFSRALHCAYCDRAFVDATPALFSFNSPVGACETCRGFGRVITVDWERVIPDPSKTLAGGVIQPWQGKSTEWERRSLAKHAEKAGIPLDVPYENLTADQRHWVMEGNGTAWPRGWPGLRGWFQWLESRAYKMHVRVLLSRYRKYETCAACQGTRLKPEALWWKVLGTSIADFLAMPVSTALPWMSARLQEQQTNPALSLLLRECEQRLALLDQVGLAYLSLDRPSRTLSGGEAQRVSLTSALGASLSSAMFVLDEPTVGLHPKDVQRLLGVLRGLSQNDNIALVVEHDTAVIQSADRVIELGPGAGEAGGHIVYDGTPRNLNKQATATARALNDDYFAKRSPREPTAWLELQGAKGNNLKDVNLRIPVGVLTCITGVSGSGKSSLILETLYPAVARALRQASSTAPLPFTRLSGVEALRGAVEVDQGPLGRTSRGNAATYLKVWEVIRSRFVREKLAKERGYKPGFFSFNVAGGGRCEECKGEGSETIEMQFLADVSFTCPVCQGRRYTPEALEVTHRGKNVADLLEMTANEWCVLFESDLEIQHRLKPLVEVGLGYLRLGQPLSTLSGGEAQRLKLAQALSSLKPRSLVVLDEPTAGLHACDIEPLMRALHELVDRGDTVVVVEHDMTLAVQSDYVIDLGPGPGSAGGHVVAYGTPTQVAASLDSVTAPFLRTALGLSSAAQIAPEHRESAARIAESRPGSIEVRGAREHNLKDLSIDIPREKLVVVTGPSGSGKSTLAFDVIFAEGQRRFLETLSPYARQYLPQLPRAAVAQVRGIPPSISLEQRTTRAGANSTVATMTEVSHYVRLLYAKVGVLHCPKDGTPIQAQSLESLCETLIRRFGKKKEIALLAPMIRGQKGAHKQVFVKLGKQGVAEVRVDGVFQPTRAVKSVDRYVEHDIDAVLARIRPSDAGLFEAVRRTMQMGLGSLRVWTADEELLLSSERTCPRCGTGYPELDPRFFSFNARQGACAACEGKGVIVEDPTKRPRTPEETQICQACNGTRLSPLARAVTVVGQPITYYLAQSVSKLKECFVALRFEGKTAEIARTPLAEVQRRLDFLEEVGLGYLSLDRAADTLSGGEMQRVRLAAQLGSGLTGVLYVLDEPTIGLHPRDTGKLIKAFAALVDKGCSLLVVEHDVDTIVAADLVLDIGPGGGRQGGELLALASPQELMGNPDSVTGRSLLDNVQTPSKRRTLHDVSWLRLSSVSEHNLRHIDVEIPLARFVSVTGVSGSGKSTLIREVLLRAVRKKLGLQTPNPGHYERIDGVQALKRAVEIDQSPIGRTPRSVPATYMGVWDEIRKLLAATSEARARGYTASRFSFNTREGRCATCEGQGLLSVEMSFLPDVLIPCETCAGQRFNPETLQVEWHNLHAGQILALEMSEALEVFAAFSKVVRPIQLLCDLGLGYLKLGQPSNTLSGGEAQRLKLVTELAAAPTAGPTLYVMDEPTTGLHRNDVQRLLKLFHKLVERGDSVVIIEHHPDVILAADWILDLGPEGGEGGGTIVATGTPEAIIAAKKSHTGRVLERILKQAAPRKAISAGFAQYPCTN